MIAIGRSTSAVTLAAISVSRGPERCGPRDFHTPERVMNARKMCNSCQCRSWDFESSMVLSSGAYRPGSKPSILAE